MFWFQKYNGGLKQDDIQTYPGAVKIQKEAVISLRTVVRVWRNFSWRCLSKLDGQQRGLSKVGFNPDLKM